MEAHRNKTLCEGRTRARPGNDIRPASSRALSFGQSAFPQGVVARICRPGRSVTTSARTGSAWRLTFNHRTAPFIEPLMGYTGGGDTLTQVELNFPTLESAIHYAERQGLTYVVRRPTGQTGNVRSRRGDDKPVQAGSSTHAFTDATLDRLGLAALQERYWRALDGAANRNDPSGPESWTSPMDVVRDPTLMLEAKRSILMNWAWSGYLIGQAPNEGMAENNRPSRRQACAAGDRGRRVLRARTRAVFAQRGPYLLPIRLPGFAPAVMEAPPSHPPPVRGRRFIDDATEPTRRNQRC
ncbi:ETC complex I subunit [Mesorhizobium sp. YIM 152430]|uniref:NADH dehydrogenase ubiquinone Fe-S protein 4 n=1 Tax=Mesorhizobium sp. YIM 152430 TaxID=3031761 RepID=UPI0023DA8BFB|nr:NADH dehydrogenase ubiquinone Fe-S protein 4 [Mesorhizobium sp. YIM 152430]MDF1599154.1 ETC complex I subunit [Mesorhizobium sp. YIM 152430]